jgi:hypothetical protein
MRGKAGSKHPAWAPDHLWAVLGSFYLVLVCITDPANLQSMIVALDQLALSILYVPRQMLFVATRLQWTPALQPATAPAGTFSEERALLHVHELTRVIGDRQVSRSVLLVLMPHGNMPMPTRHLRHVNV